MILESVATAEAFSPLSGGPGLDLPSLGFVWWVVGQPLFFALLLSELANFCTVGRIGLRGIALSEYVRILKVDEIKLQYHLKAAVSGVGAPKLR